MANTRKTAAAEQQAPEAPEVQAPGQDGAQDEAEAQKQAKGSKDNEPEDVVVVSGNTHAHATVEDAEAYTPPKDEDKDS